MLFGEASEKQLRIMMRVLNAFFSILGQKVSLMKSKMLVSYNISPDRAMACFSICSIPLTKDFSKYQGTSMIHGRVTRATYWEIIDKVNSRLSG